MGHIAKRIAGAALLVAAFAVQAAEKGKLTIWINNDKGYNGLQKVADEYTKKTGVKVKVEHFDNAVGKFEEAMANGKGPDIWIWPHDRLGDWIKRGFIAPVTPDAALRQDIVQVAWDGFTQGGKTWGYPLSVEAIALLYNKDLVPEPPKTFEEIIPLHYKLKTKGVRAIGWETESAYFTWPLLAAGGAYVFQRKIDGSFDARDTGINHPGAIKGAEFLMSMIKNGLLPDGGQTYQEAEEGMTSGKQAMWITGPWAWETLAKAKINYGVAVLPTLNGKPARPFVGVLGAMVTQSSPNKQLAAQFLESHLLQASGLAAMNQDKPLGVPASKKMFWTLYSDPRIRTSMDSIYAGRAMPSNTEMTLFWQNLTTALKDMQESAKPPRDALEAAAIGIRGQPVKMASAKK
ncbi:maltose/maltodextrin ABC transporter substrate-binding protein MalE [Piscinibacter terrae]|uniref:Maltodextrin-binding protein n=1 Tax=Piscinibacter terrae TaxID=2496871 RepID=A0A3N7HJX9_9BURK|nr:maltose/maltodextrin ABC transporter substrate-binding protein MalE [Albitalea terrae]RQP22378.1 maltose/maltodextrin ABC transporter substrate-binding protein MalE [Albitalea terrae]